MAVKIYTIGGGQMSEAILRAANKEKVITSEETIITDISKVRTEYLEKKYGFQTSNKFDEKAVVNAEIVLLGVRPQDDWQGLVKQIGLTNTKAQIISIIAGVTLQQLQIISENENIKFTRIIPNTLTDTGYGYSGVALGRGASKEIIAPFVESFGKADFIPEKQIDVYTGYAVCGPNYVYNFYLALTNAGVLAGLSRQQANKIALENIKGSVAFLESTGKHPYELLDINNSAGGCGITLQHEIDSSTFAAGIQNAVVAAVRRTTELGKE
ncbi:pyrroline-5-carboxylate reductase family protein [Liquorilactobacillus hordei]|uniref:Pyrroline-5-carboxylate reductase n=1 Tax=Liquorilactobacillus hordei TaxID=468911 RepID=A0A3Q8CA44_9LACO|nr:pyrroline-5-carboxylate reductase dimerization domain-containing protein [Liquorilactobacillus hordei]AUJ30358.1 pyrroline-5-carboxylate reductase [Liquorilactobacillus hordei]